MPVTFAAQQHSITLPSPVPGAGHSRQKRQAAGRSAGGSLYVYEKGDDRRLVELSFESLDDPSREALEDFFAEHAKGRMHSFTYTDSGGAQFAARFAESDLRFTKVARNVWDVALSLEIEETTE